MTQSKIDHGKLTISQATQEQKLEIYKHINDHWGTPETGPDYFIQYHSIIETKNYTQDGRITYWVLVPEDAKDTSDILSCCRTYRRDASVLSPSSDQPTQAIGYAIGTVVTPKKCRGQGYANHQHPTFCLSAAFSVLYSDVGTYYERCGPVPGEIGWKVQNPISTTWRISDTLPVLSSRTDLSLEIQLLSQDDVTALLSSDVPDWKALNRQPDTTYFAFSPSALPNTHLMTRSYIHPLHKSTSDVFWGANIASNGHFITWAFDHYVPATLVITRINADSSTLPLLLREAFKAGQDQDCEEAEVWNLPEDLSKEAERLGGKTYERTSHLPAYRWYGPEPAKNVVWVRNE
ncbi:hypothetical protein RhiXN_03468 [Rhizoctonia solani]|uniref:LYC1 C-terminal domain-containing protein n=1 Tax=Rhizoctonia solani TaxID=456999 RepID=A0A8H8NRH3_9AGAM|nr:uncharacterized protein RhiXN_03468 [Rhizoctonia solani]QRW18544.1 hypothetical protein RhiXN_03468 [Rhizoctonia solani]